MPSNERILTKGGRAYASKKRQAKVESVTFDAESRNEYLTGFHKRKLQRKADAKKKLEEMARKERLEERKRQREQRPSAVRFDVQEEDEKETETLETETETEELVEFADSSGILKKNKYGETTVTIESLDLDPYVDLSRAEQVLRNSTKRAEEYAKYVQSLQNPVKKKPKKKFRYKKPVSQRR